MRKLTTIILLLCTLVVGAQGAEKYFGGTAADTVGTGYTWWASFDTTLDNTANNDTLRQLGKVFETITGANVPTETGVVIFGSGDSIWCQGDKIQLVGASWELHDFNFYGGLHLSNATVNWTDGEYWFPGTGTNTAPGTAAGLLVKTTGASTFIADGVTFYAGGTGGTYFEVANLYAHKVDFSSCTMQMPIKWLTGNGAAGSRLTFDTVTVPAEMSADWDLTGVIDTLTFDSVTWSAAHNLDIADADYLTFTDCTFTNWGEEASVNPAISCTSDSVNIDSMTGCVFELASTPASVRTGFSVADESEGSRSYFASNRFGSSAGSAADDMLKWAFLIGGRPDSMQWIGNVIYAGQATTSCLNDTTNAMGTGWTWQDNIIDHTNWNPPDGASVALQWVPIHSTLSGGRIVTELSHVMLVNQDLFSNTFSAADNALMSSYNTFSDMTLTQLQTSGAAYGVVDKGRTNALYNITYTGGGSTGSTSRAYFGVGDSADVYNWTVTLVDGGGGLCSFWDDGSQDDHQAAGNQFWNCIVSGAADYVVMSSSGDGSGVTENNNNLAGLTYTTFDQDESLALASSSFDTSTGLTGSEVIARNKWFGAAATGITATDQGYYPIGVQTTAMALAVEDPEVGVGRPGFSTWIDALLTCRLLGKTGVVLNGRSTVADALNFEVFTSCRHISGDGTPGDATWEATVVDTLRAGSFK